MAIVVTRWSPDTCDCIIEYSWDDSVPSASRVHTYSSSINQCSSHASLVGVNHQNQLMSENTSKNQTYGLLINNITALTVTNVDPSGGPSTVALKPGVKFDWSFGPTRNLIVTITGATQAQKNTLQSLVDKQFGAGVVTVQ